MTKTDLGVLNRSQPRHATEEFGFSPDEQRQIIADFGDESYVLG